MVVYIVRCASSLLCAGCEKRYGDDEARRYDDEDERTPELHLEIYIQLPSTAS